MTTAAPPATLRRLRPDPAPVGATPRTPDPVATAWEEVASRSVPRLRLLRHEPDPEAAAVVRTARATRAVPAVPEDLHETAEHRRRAHHVMCLVLEVLDGRRPLTHLAAHLQPPALRYVRAAVGRPANRRPSRLTSLHVRRPCSGAVEVAAVHRAGGRTRVLAARFEGRPDQPTRWRCVTLRLL